MESLFVKGTDKTPEISFNSKAGILSFKGRSYSSDSYDFYRPINEWVNKYAQNPRENTLLEINVDYFNSVSVKYLSNLIKKLGDLSNNGKSVKINWFYSEEEEEDDNEVFDLGKSIERETTIKFDYFIIAN